MPIHPELSLGIKQPEIQTPVQSYGQVLSLRNLMTENALHNQQIQQSQVYTQDMQQQVQQRQRGLADQQGFTDAMKAVGGDIDKAYTHALNRGVSSSYITDMQEKFNLAAKNRALTSQDQIKADMAARQSMGSSIAGILALPKDQRSLAYANALANAHADPNLSKYADQAPKEWDDEWAKGAQLQGLTADKLDERALHLQQAATSQAEMLKHSADTAKVTAELPGVKAKADTEALSALTAKMGAATSDEERDSILATEDSKSRSALYKDAATGKYKTPEQMRLIGMTPDQQTTTIETGKRDAETTRYRDAEMANAASKLQLEKDRLWQDKEESKLTPEALDKAAEMFATTGTLLSIGTMGRSAAAIKSAIVNRAQVLYPNVSWASNKAVFEAGKASLAAAVKQNDLIKGYESTAGKNLDAFIQQAQKQVDTGVPWLNQPLREINEKLLGSEDQAGVNAARHVGLAETARVLTASPTGGGVVSDTARDEAQALIGKGATLKMALKAAKIIRADMKNRVDSNNDVIAAIEGRFKPEGSTNVDGQSNKTAPNSPSKAAMGGFKIGGMYGNLEYLGGDPKSKDSWKAH